MTATFRKRAGNYKIDLTRKEAATLAYADTSYSILLDALRTWPDSDSFTIYGSKYDVSKHLARAAETEMTDDWKVTWYNALDAGFGFDCGTQTMMEHLTKATAKAVARHMNKVTPAFVTYAAERN